MGHLLAQLFAACQVGFGWNLASLVRLLQFVQALQVHLALGPQALDGHVLGAVLQLGSWGDVSDSPGPSSDGQAGDESSHQGIVPEGGLGQFHLQEGYLHPSSNRKLVLSGQLASIQAGYFANEALAL